MTVLKCLTLLGVMACFQVNAARPRLTTPSYRPLNEWSQPQVSHYPNPRTQPNYCRPHYPHPSMLCDPNSMLTVEQGMFYLLTILTLMYIRGTRFRQYNFQHQGNDTLLLNLYFTSNVKITNSYIM